MNKLVFNHGRLGKIVNDTFIEIKEYHFEEVGQYMIEAHPLNIDRRIKKFNKKNNLGATNYSFEKYKEGFIKTEYQVVLYKDKLNNLSLS